MRYVGQIIFKGLAALLPVTLTLYLVYWLGVYIERLLHPVLIAVIPEQHYLPGMGVVAGLVVLFFVGLAVNAWIVQRLFLLVDGMLARIPLIKSIYGSLHDFMDYFSGTEQRDGLKQVVLVSVGEATLVGFLTREHVTDIPGLPTGGDDNIVAVYLPLSYQIGGYTMYLPRSAVRPVDMSLEDAMRRVLTAELSKPAKREKKG